MELARAAGPGDSTAVADSVPVATAAALTHTSQGIVCVWVWTFIRVTMQTRIHALFYIDGTG